MQIEPAGAPVEPGLLLAAAPSVDDTDDAIGYEAALPFLVPAPSFDDGADVTAAAF